MSQALIIALSMVVVEIPAVAVRIAPFRKVLTKKNKRTLAIAYVAILLVNFVVCFLAAQRGLLNVSFYKNKLIICGAFLLAVNIAVLPQYFLEHIFTCGVEATISTIMPVMVGYIGSHLPPFDVQIAVMLNAVAYTMIYGFAYNPIARLVSDCVEPFLELKPSGYWGTICMIPLCMFVGNYMTYPSTSYITSFSQFMGQLMIIAAVVLICMSISKDPYRLKTQYMMAHTMEIQHQYFTTLTEQINRARRELHDSKYRVAAIEKFVETDDKEGLVEFCKSMIPKRYYSVELFHSGNSAVDGILYHYSQRAEEENIRFKIAGTVAESNIPDDELSVLLGNAMENAFTACATLEKGRFVTFVAQSEAQVISLMIQNSFDGKLKIKKGVLQSRKRTQGTGFGLSSMEMICTKYGGTLETQWDDQTFTVLIILPVDPPVKDEM